MADEQRDLVINLLLNLPDSKVHPLDTREAEASLERVRQKAQQVNREIATGMQGATAGGVDPMKLGFGPGAATLARGPGGMPIIVPGTGAAPRPPTRSIEELRALERAAFERAGTPFLQTPWGTNPAHGPISDGGSHARSSLQTARGYNMALQRQFLQQYTTATAGMMGGGQAFRMLGQGMSSMTYNIGGLLAGTAMLQASMQEGSPFNNLPMMAMAGVYMAGNAAQISRGAAMTLQGGRVLANRTAIRIGATVGSRALMGAGATSLGAGAAVGTGVVGAAVTLPLLAAYGYYSYQNYRAEQRGEELDEELAGLNRYRAQREAIASQVHARRDNYSEFRMSMAAASRMTLPTTGLAGINAFERHAAWMGAMADRETNPALRIMGLTEEGVSRRQRLAVIEGTAQGYERQIGGLRSELQAATGVAADVGRLTRNEHARGLLAARRFREDGSLRSARQVEAIFGYRPGGAATEMINDYGQSVIDANPELLGILGDDVRTGSEIGELREQIKRMQTRRDELLELLVEETRETEERLRGIAIEIAAIKRREKDKQSFDEERAIRERGA